MNSLSRKGKFTHVCCPSGRCEEHYSGLNISHLPIRLANGELLPGHHFHRRRHLDPNPFGLLQRIPREARVAEHARPVRLQIADLGLKRIDVANPDGPSVVLALDQR